jgi:hypothetical protein
MTVANSITLCHSSSDDPISRWTLSFLRDRETFFYDPRKHSSLPIELVNFFIAKVSNLSFSEEKGDIEQSSSSSKKFSVLKLHFRTK